MLVAPRVVNACQPDGPPASPEKFDSCHLEAEPGETGLWPMPVESSIDIKPKQGRADRKPGKASFPRTARLLKPADFKRVFKKSTTSSDRYLKVLGSMNSSGCSRLGMAVSRQVDKHAVGRNRIKRVIREYFRNAFPVGIECPADGIDLVVLPRRESATISNSQLTASLSTHCMRIVRTLNSKSGATAQQTPRPGTRRANQEAGTN